MAFRLIHIIHLKHASFLLEYALQWALPYSRIVRGQINSSIRITYIIILAVHFCVVFWLFIGSRKIAGDDGLTWIEVDPRVKAYDHF